MRLKAEYSRLLSRLPTPISTKLFANAKLVRLATGEILFRAGVLDDGCYRIEEGLLKVTILPSSARAPSWVSVRGAAVSFLSCADFEACAEKHPEVYKSLVKILAQRLRETDTVVAASSFLSLKGRVARMMLELAGHFGQEV